jgi:hypothetical protein
MSEKFPANEAHENHEQSRQSPEQVPEQAHEQIAKTPEKSEKHSDIEQIRSSIDAHAKESAEIRSESEAQPKEQAHEQTFINRELKEIAYQRLLIRARRHFNSYDRTLSRIIHQPTLDTISEAASKSVGRPSGILGGGLTALIGTVIYYLVAKHYGYAYNFLVFVVLIFIGFLLGWAVELLWHLLRRPKKT